MKILIIGGGNMGLTYARSFVRAHVTSRLDLRLLARSPERVAALAAHEIGTAWGSPEECVPGVNIIILAVKPQDSGALFEHCAAWCSRSKSSSASWRACR
jgi:pyrroline-5-carboxylate reductase